MGTPARYYSSTAVTTTLSLSISSTDVAIQVASSSGFPSSYPFTLILAKDSANEEILTVTALVGSQFTVTRGVDGTSLHFSHTAGTSVEHGVSALDFTDQRSHQAAGSDVHDIGSTASVVGTDTTQTLTNKTLTSTTLGGDLTAGTNKITGLGDPASAQDAATKNYVDTGASSQVVAATLRPRTRRPRLRLLLPATAASTSESNSANSATASATARLLRVHRKQRAHPQKPMRLLRLRLLFKPNAAASSASAASASETASASSQTAAASSETNAAASAISATASAASAAATYDQFDDRYLESRVRLRWTMTETLCPV